MTDEPIKPETEDPVEAESPEATETPSEDERTMEDLLAQAIAERDEQADRALRAQAELDNVRKRLAREAQQLQQFAILPLVADLLPSLDNLHRAIQAAEASGNVEELLQGIQMVSGSFADTLSRHHVSRIPTEGESFDPNLHEALSQVPSPDHEPMQIIQEVETGWQLHDRVIRPGKVIVSSGPPQA